MVVVEAITISSGDLLIVNPASASMPKKDAYKIVGNRL
jgi:hypothetical protein